MAECKDIDKALANLGSALDQMKQKMRALEAEQRRCCADKEPQQKTDLTAIQRRLDKIENYINSLDNVGNLIRESFNQMINIFSGDS